MRRAVTGAALRYALAILLCAALWIYAASPWMLALLLLLLLLPLLSLLWNLAARRALTGTLRVPSSANKRSEITVRVSASAARLASGGSLWCRLRVRNDLCGEESVLTIPLTPDGRGDLCGTAALSSAHCGRLRIRAEHWLLLDAAGLFPVKKAANLEEKCTVLPETFPVSLSLDHLASLSDETESLENARGGADPTELFQLREYQRGDSVRGIHWKLTAKLDTPIFREPGQPENRRLLVFWDKTPCAAAVQDALAESVFSVAQALTEAGCPFALAWAERGEVQRAEVGDQDALLRSLPLLLRSAEGGAQPDCSRYGRTLRFAATPPETADASVLTLCCTEDGAGAGYICFAPETAADALQRLDI